MARPELFTYDEVAKACADLAGRGMLTANNLITELGGGSKTTILRHLNRWHDERRAVSARPLEQLLSDDLRAALSRQLEAVSKEAKTEVQEKLLATQDQLRAALASLEQAEEDNEGLRRAAADAAQAALAKESELARQLAEQAGQLEVLNAHAKQLQAKLDREIHTAESARIEAAQARNKVEATDKAMETCARNNEAMAAELKTMQKALAEAQQRAAVADAHAKHRDEQLAEVRRNAQSAAEALQGRLLQAEEQARARDKQLAVAQQAAHEKSQAAEILQVRLTESEARANRHSEQLAEARQAIEYRAKAVETLQARLGECEKKLSVAERDLAVCREQNRKDAEQGGAPESGAGKATPKSRPRAEKADDEGVERA